MGKQPDHSLKKAGKSSERLVTAYTLTGFWDEGSGRLEDALKR